MSFIIGPVGYLGNTPSELYGLMEKLAEEGSEENFNELERKTIQAIEARNGLSNEEMDALSDTLKDDRYEIIRTGKYLDPIYALIQKANESVYGNEFSEEDRREMLSLIFIEGLLDIRKNYEKSKTEEFYEDMNRDSMKALIEFLEQE